jgi:DNA-directed RNA polymerase specialized sigma subunit
MDIIRQMPLIYGGPLMMRATLGASLQEIADHYGVTQSAIQRKIIKGIKIIQLSLLDG